MSISIANLKSALERKLHGTTLNKLQDPDGIIFEAASNFLQFADPHETKRSTQIPNALYDQVDTYVAPTDIKGDSVFDIKPQVNRNTSDNFSQLYEREFSQWKLNNTFQIDEQNGIKTIKIVKGVGENLLINSCNSLTSNGAWVAGGSASNLAVDNINYVTGGASLKFDATGASSEAYIENTTMSAVDLTAYLNVASIFVWIYVPDPDAILSAGLRFGTNSSNYYLASDVQTSQDGVSFVNGWNLLRFDWNLIGTIGSPTINSIRYARVTFNYDSTPVASCRVDSITARIGVIYEILYYSKYLFKNNLGVYLEQPSSDSDTLILDTDAANCVLYEAAFLAAQEIQGKNADFDATYFEKKRNEVWKQYSNRYKSEKIKRRSTYWRNYPMKRR